MIPLINSCNYIVQVLKSAAKTLYNIVWSHFMI